MSSGGKRKYKTLRTTPLPKLVAQEVAASRRPAESAAKTDAHIRAGLHPLVAYAASRQSVKPAKKDRRPRG